MAALPGAPTQSKAPTTPKCASSLNHHDTDLVTSVLMGMFTPTKKKGRGALEFLSGHMSISERHKRKKEEKKDPFMDSSGLPFNKAYLKT